MSWKLNKTEKDVLLKFLENPEAIVTITWVEGSDRIRGLSRSMGQREYKATLALIEKGILDLVEKRGDTLTKTLTVKLNPKHKHILDEVKKLTDDDLRLLSAIYDWNKNEWEKKGLKAKEFRKLTKREEKVFRKLVALGYIRDDVFYPVLKTDVADLLRTHKRKRIGRKI